MAQWDEATQSWSFAAGEAESQVAQALSQEPGERGVFGVHVRYLANEEACEARLSNGVRILIPTQLVEGLAGQSIKELQSVQLLPDGDTLAWEGLNLHVSLLSLMASSFGSAAWNEALEAQARRRAAAHAGRASSPKKAASAARNGRKGGRPKKTPLGPEHHLPQGP